MVIEIDILTLSLDLGVKVVQILTLHVLGWNALVMRIQNMYHLLMHDLCKLVLT